MRTGPLPWDSSAHWRLLLQTCRQTGTRAHFGKDLPSTTRLPQWKISSLPAQAEFNLSSNPGRQDRQPRVPQEDHRGSLGQHLVKLTKKGNQGNHLLRNIRKGQSTTKSQHLLQRERGCLRERRHQAGRLRRLRLHQSRHQRILEVLHHRTVFSIRLPS